MNKKLISLFLLASMAAASLASCGGDGSGTNNDTTASSGETTTEAVDDNLDSHGFLKDEIHADAKFGGAEVNMLIREAIANTEFFVEEATGDIVDDALVSRNNKVEERLGVKLNFITMPGEWGDRDNFNGAIKQSVLAGDGAYDICAVLSNQLATLTLDGLLTNLNKLQYLDFEKPWWAKGLLDELAVDDKLYFASGDASLGLINGMMCVFYNKKLCEDFQIPDLYEIVNSGEWTIDKAVELTTGVYQDLNGDDKKGPEDRLGFATGSYNQLYGFIDSFNLQVLERDSEGLPSKVVFDSEKVVNAVDKLVSLFKDNNEFATMNKDASDYSDAFKAGNVLFCTGEFKDTSVYRDISAFDYGVIPFPKYDTAQKDYRTTARATYSSFCVPVTAKNADMSAAVLECFASESYRQVSPAYFETALKVKYSRDDETSQMFDLIKSSVTFSFATSFTMAINDPQNTFKQRVSDLESDWASYMATWKPAAEEKLSKTLETIKELP